jgi:hypothetical protein
MRIAVFRMKTYKETTEVILFDGMLLKSKPSVRKSDTRKTKSEKHGKNGTTLKPGNPL